MAKLNVVQVENMSVNSIGDIRPARQDVNPYDHYEIQMFGITLYVANNLVTAGKPNQCVYRNYKGKKWIIQQT